MNWLLVKILNTCLRSKADREGQFVSVRGRTYPDVERIEPQGVHFALAPDAQGLLHAPGGEVSAVVAGNHSGDVPSDVLAPGEGGLHYLGTFKVFVDAAGMTHLGAKVTTDFVALASKVDAGFAQVKADFTALQAAIATGLTSAAGLDTSAGTAFTTAMTGAGVPHTVPSAASANVGCT